MSNYGYTSVSEAVANRALRGVKGLILLLLFGRRRWHITIIKWSLSIDFGYYKLA